MIWDNATHVEICAPYSECTALKCSRGNISVLDSASECKGDGEKEGEDGDEAEWEKEA